MLNVDMLENLRRFHKVAEVRDAATGKHTQRIASHCKLLAKAMGLSSDFVSNLFFAAPMHDIGKVGISDNILLKPVYSIDVFILKKDFLKIEQENENAR